jgi:hypothetical protein
MQVDLFLSCPGTGKMPPPVNFPIQPLLQRTVKNFSPGRQHKNKFVPHWLYRSTKNIMLRIFFSRDAMEV